MGRKNAPKPLALDGIPDAPGADPPVGLAETYKPPLTSPPPSSRSPTSPSSPRSPRAAGFAFHQRNTQQISAPHGLSERQQPLHVAELLDQAPQPQAQPPLDTSQHPPPLSSLHSPQRQQYPTGDTSLVRSPQYPSQPEPIEAQQQHFQEQQVQQQPYQHQQQQSQQPYLQQPVQQPDRQSPSPSGRQYQQPPPSSHRHHRNHEEKASKSGFFFSFTKSSKPSDRTNTEPYQDSRSDLSPAPRQNNRQQADPPCPSPVAQRQTTNDPHLPSRSEHSLAPSGDYGSTNAKKGKPKPFTLLGRSRSIKDKDRNSPSYNISPGEANRSPNSAPTKAEPDRAYAEKGGYTTTTTQQFPSPRTAPIQAHDRSFRDMMSSSARNHSADRAPTRDVSNHNRRDNQREAREHPRAQQPPSGREPPSSSGFFSGLKSSGGKAADMLSGRLFGKSGRSFSTTDREPTIDDEHYILRVINLPLVEQTRRTRICKRLEDSNDKTEFWMPAFPWRAIDYLNYKGSDVEGLYRVPGSGPQIKKWQRKFDEELDVNLFEQKDLYDINIIGSMLKAWLRELPDELFPKEAQERVVRECAGAETVPQLLIDELSNLSPFNYYLLFAITCHLSLLLAHSDKNKMDFRNLCICFQPCMKIDVFCFKFLVCDWRDCWKGCKNEAKYIEEEYALLFNTLPPTVPGESRRGSPANEAVEERNISSSGSSKLSAQSAEHPQGGRLRKQPPKTAPADNRSAETASTISTNLTVQSERMTPPERSGSNELRPLSPIKPLSPLGF